jgi:hypothetical protein
VSEEPWLEVICASDSDLTPGQRLPLEGAFGRAMNCDVRIASSHIGRKHSRFGIDKGRPWVQDLVSTHGTFVNGVNRGQTRVFLSPGDYVEMGLGVVLRVSGGQGLSFDPSNELARQVAEAPHDDGRWRVWADHLLERGDPLGERIARGRGVDLSDDAKAMGPLARELVAGGVEIDWRHGFIRRAVLRNHTQWPPPTWLSSWELLLMHPLAWFIEELEVDALSYTHGVDRGDREGVEDKIVASLEVLAKVPPFPCLTQVRFGPSPRPLWNPQLEASWRRATEVHSKLRTGPIWVARQAWLQLLGTPPGVTVTGLELGAQRKLVEEGANRVGPLADCTFALVAPDGSPASEVALKLDRENGLWVAEDVATVRRRRRPPLQVNGRPCTHHRLRPHDRLEPAPGLLFQFVME